MVAAREAWISRLPNITPFFWYASSAGNWALVSGITWKAVSKNRVIADPAGVVAEEGHTDRHVAHRHRRLAAELVDHHHIDLGQEHGVVDQHEADEPTPACEPPRREEPAKRPPARR
jgi:hypothetical protein